MKPYTDTSLIRLLWLLIDSIFLNHHLFYRSVNRDYVSHGEMVVRGVGESEGIVEFQRRWRQHFLDTMKPAYLPKLWSVDHNPNFDS